MDRNRALGRRPAVVVALGGLAAVALTGCVERRYTVRTDPPGALVVVNDEEIGPSPTSRSFTYYGTRKITLIKDGYQTQTILQPLDAPWWDAPVIDFFSENVVPVTLRDEREFVYKLTPATVPASNDLIQRAEGMRQAGNTPPPPRRGGLLGFFGF